MTERLVTNGTVSLATTDLGGEGPAIVLMHGLGGTRKAMAKVAAGLSPTWRVISMDLRGHGASGSAPFSWEAAVADLEAVISAHGLHNPVVAGHSLGGMISLLYGQQHPECPGVINIDGWGVGIPSQYPGQDPVAVTDFIDRAGSGQAGGLLTKLVMRLTRQGKEGTTARVLELLHGADLVAWQAAIPCRSLAFHATAPLAGLIKLLNGKENCTLLASYHVGLRAALDALVAADERASVVEIPDATHSLIGTHPSAVVAGINAFTQVRAT